MSERTPQDVLRELRSQIEKLPYIIEYGQADDDRDKPSQWVKIADIEILIEDALDKAIAEAPDSPPTCGALYDGIMYCERRAWHFGPHRDQRDAPDTLSEKPGLADLDWLMGRVVARFSDSEYHRAKDIILRMAGFPTARALKETVRSGSTDSEGR